MSEWWTYSLSDFLLFSPRTYYRLFELYNDDIWPAQVAALALGAAILALIVRGPRGRGRAVAVMLAACWLFVAWAYLLRHYDTINWAARYFAAGFAIEALLLLVAAARGNLSFRGVVRDAARSTGFALFAFALVLQPLIGPLLARPFAQIELFGAAPDPTVVGTLGVLLAARRVHWTLLVVPLLWCAVGGATLWAMQAPDAAVMPAAAVAATALSALKSRAFRNRGARVATPHE